MAVWLPVALQPPLTSRMKRERHADGAICSAMELATCSNVQCFAPSIALALGSYFLRLSGALNLELQGPAVLQDGVSKLPGQVKWHRYTSCAASPLVVHELN